MEKMDGQYGNGYAVKGNMTPEMKNKGNVKNNIPNAMTNKVGADKKFDGGKTSGVAYVHDRKCYQD
jgi:hypothetical protein